MWNVENQTSIQKYTVERSDDGKNFMGILSVKASHVDAYSKRDLSPLKTNNYYRIVASTFAGENHFSEELKVSEIESTQGSVSIFPNPATGGQINIRFKDVPQGRF